MSSFSDSPANEAPFRVIEDCRFGEDVVVRQFANLYGCEVGGGTRIGSFVEIQAEALIGRRCKIQSHAFICAGVTIGDGVFVGHGVIFVNDKRPRATAGDGGLAKPEDWELLPISIGDEATIGSAAVILGGVKIGAGAMIGAGAVVSKDVPEGATVVGIPARARDQQ